ncbi:uncharacterized protein DUF4249 [Flavobacterium cutihirudinis]|uniref:Uncharacterized protein DUF4249 n=1 Tax=Flavobacterium cutihirudinis TaxID=1265740 RepID=A0A3D9FX33_9FLAO|nr:DUF4249 domain-containing protein [Flavobacterium cutihirudinis]RED25321.1 uncharacterized protein DUF4249 [Flavobacterium cutihirudinis]
MKDFNLKNIILFLGLAVTFNSCTEPFPLITNNYEEALVVDATITNELKNQVIKLTKTSRFEDEGVTIETGAEVYITDDTGTKYEFEENDDKYSSLVEFQAVAGKKYQLHVNTRDGRSFESSPETLTTVNPMESVTAAAETKDDILGIGIRIKSFDASGKSTYYRFEYEETYKVVAPKWVNTKATLGPDGNLIFSQNTTDTKICYGGKKSSDLMLANNNDLSEDRINYLIRFINSQDYITTTRYSILVRQYVESLNAYTYYNTLKKMSSSESILSPNQPGLLVGNVKSIKNPGNKVVGYFDVASVSTERIYFNHEDIFPHKPSPPYVTDCTQFCYGDETQIPEPCTHALPYTDDLVLRKITYFLTGGFYYWVEAPCGDCTTIASSIKPPFWTD